VTISTARLFGVTLTIERILKGDAVNTILRSKACCYAIKFGDKLSDYDMRLLVRQSFSKCKKPFICAHGRPTIYPLIKL
jgi:DNA mismatch repair protein MLH3